MSPFIYNKAEAALLLQATRNLLQATTLARDVREAYKLLDQCIDPAGGQLPLTAEARRGLAGALHYLASDATAVRNASGSHETVDECVERIDALIVLIDPLNRPSSGHGLPVRD